jgi:hypothetical protein
MGELKPNRKLFPDYLSFILHGVLVGGWFTVAWNIEEVIFTWAGVGEGRFVSFVWLLIMHSFCLSPILGNGA